MPLCLTVSEDDWLKAREREGMGSQLCIKRGEGTGLASRGHKVLVFTKDTHSKGNSISFWKPKLIISMQFFNKTKGLHLCPVFHCRIGSPTDILRALQDCWKNLSHFSQVDQIYDKQTKKCTNMGQAWPKHKPDYYMVLCCWSCMNIDRKFEWSKSKNSV